MRSLSACSWFSGGLAGGNLTVSSCANINPGGDAVVTVLSSPNAAGGPWACVGGDDGARCSWSDGWAACTWAAKLARAAAKLARAAATPTPRRRAQPCRRLPAPT